MSVLLCRSQMFKSPIKKVNIDINSVFLPLISFLAQSIRTSELSEHYWFNGDESHSVNL